MLMFWHPCVVPLAFAIAACQTRHARDRARNAASARRGANRAASHCMPATASRMPKGITCRMYRLCELLLSRNSENAIGSPIA